MKTKPVPQSNGSDVKSVKSVKGALFGCPRRPTKRSSSSSSNGRSSSGIVVVAVVVCFVVNGEIPFFEDIFGSLRTNYTGNAVFFQGICNFFFLSPTLSPIRSLSLPFLSTKSLQLTRMALFCR